MAPLLKEFIRELDEVRKGLNRTTGQVHAQSKRDALRALAEKYFGIIRPSVLPPQAQDPDVSQVDAEMQVLVELCHKHGMANRYKEILKKCRTSLITLDSRLLISGSVADRKSQTNETDNLICSTLEKILPSAATAYRQGLMDLAQTSRSSWRGPAADLREALRETLDHFAPDVEVKKDLSYKLETNAKGPTMKQKVRHILKVRGLSRSQSAPAELAAESVDEVLGLFVRSVYTRCSVSTHTSTSRDEVIRIRELVRVVLSELLEIRF
jgi:hypothetical protein